MGRGMVLQVVGLCVVASCGVLLGCGSGSSSFSGVGPPPPPPRFSPGPPTYVGGAPIWTASGYINGDAHLDLAVGDFLSGRASILLGRGDGTFDAAAPVTFGILENAARVALGHFNHDAYLDLAVLDDDEDQLHIFLGDGTGEFQPTLMPPIQFPGGSVDMKTARLDGDVYSDIVVLNSVGVYLLLCNGDGTFTITPASPVPVGPAPTSLGVFDFGGSHTPDVIVGDQNEESLRGYISDGLGGLLAIAPYALGQWPLSIAGIGGTCYVVSRDLLDPDAPGALNVLEFNGVTLAPLGTTPITIEMNSGFVHALHGRLTPPYVVVSALMSGLAGVDIHVFRNAGSGLLVPGESFSQAAPLFVTSAGDFDEASSLPEVVLTDPFAGEVRTATLAADLGAP